MQRQYAHLRIMIRQLQMFSQLDCLISSTFQCIMQFNNSLPPCSASGGMALSSIPTTSCWVPSICFYTFHYSTHLFFILLLVAKLQMFLSSYFPSTEYPFFNLKSNKPKGEKNPQQLFKQWELKTGTSLSTEKVTSASAKFQGATAK